MNNLTRETLINLDTLMKIQDVLKYGSPRRPRSVLQAYNAFLQQWTMVKLRGIDKELSPCFLAVLLTIRYMWPDVFQEIINNPYFFFYLHSLATHRPNDICSQMELDEINTLALPVEATDVHLFSYRKYPSIIRVLDVLNLSDILSGRKDAMETFIIQHLTISDNSMTTVISNSELQEWEALNSGNPADIRLASTLSTGNLLIYGNQMLDFLSGLNERIHKSNDKEKENIINKAELILFALGRIDFEHGVELLNELIINKPSIPENLQLRVIFALGRYGKKSERAKKVLVDFLICKKLPFSIRPTIAKILSYCTLDGSSVQNLWIYYQSDINSRVRYNLLENWASALEGVDPEEITVEFLDILEKVPWPQNFAPKLIDFCLNSNEDAAKQAFNLILKYGDSPSHEKREQTIQWLVDILINSQKFRERCWEMIADLQSSRGVQWQEQEWQRLKQWSIENGDCTIIDFLRAIKNKENKEDVELILISLLEEKEMTHCQNQIEEVLQEFEVRTSR